MMLPNEIQQMIRDALTSHDASTRPLVETVAQIALDYGPDALLVGTHGDIRIDVGQTLTEHGESIRTPMVSGRPLVAAQSLRFANDADRVSNQPLRPVTAMQAFIVASRMMRGLLPMFDATPIIHGQAAGSQ